MHSEQHRPEKKQYVRAKEARLTIDCSLDQKRKIKMLAASKDMTITDFLLTLVEERYSKCPYGFNHTPNVETIEAIEESERGEGLHSFDSPEEMFKNLGL